MAEGKGGRSLLIERGKEMNNERAGQLNLLMIHQAYLNRKVQIGAINRLPELLHVKALINEWLAQECENLKIQSRIEEVETPDLVCIYHHELHIKKTKRSIILKLQTKERPSRRSLVSFSFPLRTCWRSSLLSSYPIL